MMANYSSVHGIGKSPGIKKSKDAERSLNNYINQLEFHFDLNNDEIVIILESILKTKRNDNFKKKWWQIWK